MARAPTTADESKSHQTKVAQPQVNVDNSHLRIKAQSLRKRESLPFPSWQGFFLLKTRKMIHPRKLTWNLKITQIEKENHLPKLHEFGFKNINFAGCSGDIAVGC